MKYHLEKIRTHKTAKPEDKIVIENINVTQNERGQWLVDFASKNHKYLQVRYIMSSGHIDRKPQYLDDGSLATCEAFVIDTHEEAQEDGFTLPLSSTVLWLIPETREECSAINGVAAIMATKWCYCCCIVAYNDFAPDDNNKNIGKRFKQKK